MKQTFLHIYYQNKTIQNQSRSFDPYSVQNSPRIAQNSQYRKHTESRQNRRSRTELSVPILDTDSANIMRHILDDIWALSVQNLDRKLCVSSTILPVFRTISGCCFHWDCVLLSHCLDWSF